MEPSNEQKPASKNTRLIVVGVVFLVAIVFAIQAIYDYATAVDYRAINDGEWKKITVGTPPMQFECPVQLEDKSKPPIGQEQELIKSNQIFMYQKGYDLYICASIIDYLPHVYVSPAAVAESIKGFEQQFGATDIDYKPYDLIMGNYRATRSDGSMTIDGNKYIFSRVTVEHRNNFRDLLVIVRADDLEALLVKNRMAGTLWFEPF